MHVLRELGGKEDSCQDNGICGGTGVQLSEGRVAMEGGMVMVMVGLLGSGSAVARPEGRGGVEELVESREGKSRQKRLNSASIEGTEE